MASGFFEGCATNVLATLFIDYLVKPAVSHLGYVFRFNKIVKDLVEHSNQLSSKQESMEKDVKEAKNQIQDIVKVVEDWLTEARKVQQEINELEEKIKENKMCCFNWCPNLSWRYRLSKQAAEKRLAISKLMNSVFQRVGHPTDLPGLWFLPSKDFLTSKSADLAESQIVEALKDDGVNIIGLWGMGGIGKTTLVKEVGRKAKESELFGEVVNVVVSQNQNIEKIQDTIAESLNSTLDKKSEAGKAEQLWVRLKKEKSILIILDDLWKELDLKAVGLPIGEHHKGCKILITTRSQRVCSVMRSGRVVKLDGLEKDEAWKLFKMSAELDDDTTSPEILNLAAQVAEECKGLPIAISTLGTALKGASIHEWSEACRNLKGARLLDMECVDEDKNAYKCLKFSYDFLRREETKTCFLFCSIYPEDCSIPVEELVRHLWGLELFQGIKSIQEARGAVYTAVDNLKASSLLLDDGLGFIKMHDMVRDVALWIAGQKENHVIIKSEAGTSEWPGNENFEAHTAISFMDCKLKEIPKGLEYPKLKLLSFMQDGVETPTISGASFEGMKSLKVLNLSLKGSLSDDALLFLSNLQTLCLECCSLNSLNTYSISSLRELKKLEILSFYGSDIKVLPDEVGDLKSLRLLDLSSCERLKMIPPNVIQRLSQLEELYFSGCGFDEWLIEGTDAEVKNASLFELHKLSHLAILVLKVGNPESILKNFVFPKLQKYSIAIESRTEEVYPSKRCLKISSFASFKAFKNLFEDVELLELCRIGRLQNIVPRMHLGSLNSLSILRTRSCPDMECIVDTRKQPVPVAFSHLSALKIEDMNSFRQLISNGLPPNGFLKNLESFEIKNCHCVKSLFPSSVMQSLLQLKSLEIGDCRLLEQIFMEIQIEGANEVLQKLQSLKISKCGSLKSLFPRSVAQKVVQLKNLEIVECLMLEQIFEQMEGQRLSTALALPPYLLPKLKTLEIRGCSKLNLECLVDTRKQHLAGIALSNLEKLVLDDITSLETLCNGESPQPQAFLQKLQTLKIRRCSSMTCLFPWSFAQNLVQLEDLEIKDCNMLKRLVMEADFEMLSNSNHPPCLQQLNSLEIRGCSKLEYIFPSSFGENLLRLRNLSLNGLNALKEVVGPRKGRVDRSDVVLNLPSLQCIDLLHCPCLRPFSIFSSQMKVISFKFSGQFKQVAPQSSQSSPNMEYAVIGNVEEMFKLQGGTILSNLRRFVASLPRSSAIWRSPNEVVTLQNLMVVELIECWRLRYVFSPMLAPNLPKLEFLKIFNCPVLEQIIDTSQDCAFQPLSFPNLTSIFVERCDSLKYVFPISILRDLQHLKVIRISEASKLKQIFGFEDKADAKDLHHHAEEEEEEEERVKLPKLEELSLEKLSSLISFSSVDDHIPFPSLTHLKVTCCYGMTTTFTIDPQRCAHAKPKGVETTDEDDFVISPNSFQDSVAPQEIRWPRGSDIEWEK